MQRRQRSDAYGCKIKINRSPSCGGGAAAGAPRRVVSLYICPFRNVMILGGRCALSALYYNHTPTHVVTVRSEKPRLDVVPVPNQLLGSTPTRFVVETLASGSSHGWEVEPEPVLFGGKGPTVN